MVNTVESGGGETTIDAITGSFQFESDGYKEITVKQKPRVVVCWTEHTSSTDYNTNSCMWIDNVQSYPTASTPRTISALYSSSTPSQWGATFTSSASLGTLNTVSIVSITDSKVKFRASTTSTRTSGRDFKYIIVY